jgi:hypothetical protein
MQYIGLEVTLRVINRDAKTEELAGIKTPKHRTGNVGHAIVSWSLQ